MATNPIITNHEFFRKPLSVAQANAVLDTLAAQKGDGVVVIEDTGKATFLTGEHATMAWVLRNGGHTDYLRQQGFGRFVVVFLGD